MARTLYSKRFLLEKTLSTSASFTVDDGFVVVIRDVSGYFGSQTTAPSIQCQINDVIFFEASTDPLALAPFQWQGRQVLEAGDVFTAYMQNGDCDVSVSGYLLTTP